MGRRKHRKQRRQQEQRTERRCRKEKERQGKILPEGVAIHRWPNFNPLELPPRADEPVEQQIAWYEHAVKSLGGFVWRRAGTPELHLSDLVVQFSDMGGRCRKLKDYFLPPLEIPNPADLSADEHQSELEACLERLEACRMTLVFCEHQSPAAVLSNLRHILDEEGDPPPLTGTLVIHTGYDCPECERELWDEELWEDESAA